MNDKNKCKTIMVQGTASHVGKSLLVTALCRIFSDMGYRVAPFKSQNMSLNSYVNETGEEIARSQIVQAIAARTKPIAEHNPILLKPKGEESSQIILMGKPYKDYTVGNYYRDHIPQLIPYIKIALNNLQKNNDIIVIEGAGSPAEINIMERDIANMYVAKLSKAPVLLCADIDRGGVFASIYGTIKLLPKDEQDLVKFFVINKFRGNNELLKDGIDQIELLIEKKCVGVLPYLQDLRIPAEDSVSLNEGKKKGNIKIKVIKLPQISNFNDFEPLEWEPEIQVSYISEPEDLNNADLVIIPGTKNTVKDLLWMNEKGFSAKLNSLIKSGTLIAGICGGYQMLGNSILDKAIEGESDNEYKALGFLPIKTEFLAYEKITRQVCSEIIGFSLFKGIPIEGYEIHMGKITYLDGAIPLLQVKNGTNNTFDGAINKQNNVFGSFIHGIWNNDRFRKEFIRFLAKKKNRTNVKVEKQSYNDIIETNIQKLAHSVKENINIAQILAELGL
ncbi:MAG: cobyric acid synthase [Promethearchaeota archaeon]